MIFSTIIRGVTTIVQFVEHSGFAKKRRPLVATIQRMSAEHFGFHPDLMKAQGRTREIAQSRQIAMYLARELTTHSLPQIGRFFGNRDHTTVLHAIRVVEKRICTSVEVAEHVEAIREMLAA